MKDDFWDYLEKLLSESRIVIDRPKDSHHPNYPDVSYPPDDGYLEGTTSGDNALIDVWSGIWCPSTFCGYSDDRLNKTRFRNNTPARLFGGRNSNQFYFSQG